MNNKTSQGRKKIEIKKIEKYTSRHVTFSKRRNGLFKKGAELCVLTGAKISIIVNSPGGRVFAFGHPNVDALINTYLANKENVDVDLDMGQSALPINEFNNHYEDVSRELELEMKRKDMIPENSGREFCPNMNNNTHLAIQGPTVLQHLKGPEMNVLEGPNVLSLHGLNVFYDAWKNNNGQYYFDPALMINANVQGQGSVNYNHG
nr:agamous-like MADS-box protein AGL62 [Tanacetum cinerariifolium]